MKTTNGNLLLLEKINRVEMNLQMAVDWYRGLNNNYVVEDSENVNACLDEIQYAIDKLKKKLK